MGNSFKKLFYLILISSLFYSNFSFATNSKPYVILISFDGFRWDYPDRGLTPNLNIMVNNGIRALSPIAWLVSLVWKSRIIWLSANILYSHLRNAGIHFIKNQFSCKEIYFEDSATIEDINWIIILLHSRDWIKETVINWISLKWYFYPLCHIPIFW